MTRLRFPVPPVRPSTEPVPGELRRTLNQAFGVDVGDRPVQRGPEAARRATAMGARAFTRAGEVFLPHEAGPLDRPPALSILAHELTHVAQQRLLGTGLPPEGSPEGRRLEAAAREVERHVRGDAGALPPAPELVHPPAPLRTEPARFAQQVADELVEQGLARRDDGGALVFDVPPPADAPSAPTEAGVQRLQGEAAQAPAIRNFGDLGSVLEGGLRATVLDSWNLFEASGGHQDSGTVRPGVPGGVPAAGAVSRPGTGGGAATGGPAAGGPPAAARAPAVAATAEHHADRSRRSAGRSEQQAQAASTQAQHADRHATDAERHAGEAQEHAAAASDAATRARSGPAGPGGRRAPSGGGVAAQAPAIRNFADFGTALGADVSASFLDSFNVFEESGGRQDEGEVRLGNRPATARPGRAAVTAPGGVRTGVSDTPPVDDPVGAARGSTASGRPQLEVDDRNLEELARKLYDRLRAHLRTELLVDRERAGLLTDFR